MDPIDILKHLEAALPSDSDVLDTEEPFAAEPWGQLAQDVPGPVSADIDWLLDHRRETFTRQEVIDVGWATPLRVDGCWTSERTELPQSPRTPSGQIPQVEGLV